MAFIVEKKGENLLALDENRETLENLTVTWMVQGKDPEINRDINS